MINDRNAEKRLRNLTYMIHGPFCEYCGRFVSPRKFHFEHKIPYSRNGKTDIVNGTVSCKNCNLQKGAKTDKEYFLWRKKHGLKSGKLFSFLDFYIGCFAVLIALYIYIYFNL